MPGPRSGRRVSNVGAVDEIVAKLRSDGSRITAARRATIEVLVESGPERHLIAEDIVAEVRSRHRDVAESTIYRTLSALEELGVVTHIHMGHGPSTFHLTDAAHQHLVCRVCGDVTEVDPHLFEEVRIELLEGVGFDADFGHFAITGTCDQCRARPDAGRPAEH
jgi:Fur family ferric uptake transcriptional regulator